MCYLVIAVAFTYYTDGMLHDKFLVLFYFCKALLGVTLFHGNAMSKTRLRSARRVQCSRQNLYKLSQFSRFRSRCEELRTQELKSYLVRTQTLNVLPLKPGVVQYIAIHATLTARDFFLAYFYPSGPFTRIFSKTSPDFSCVGCG